MLTKERVDLTPLHCFEPVMRMLLMSRRESSRPSMYIWCRRLLCQPICEPWKFQNQYRQLAPGSGEPSGRLEAVGVASRVVLVDLRDVEVDVTIVEVERRVDRRVVAAPGS